MTALAKLFRTTVFKLSLIYLVIFAIGSSAVIGWAAWSMRRLVEEQIRAAIDAEIKGLAEQYAQGGIRRLVFVVDRRTRRPGSALYLVTNFQGVSITGNVAVLPVGVIERPGLTETQYQRHETQTMDRRALARIFLLPGGFRLLVGRDLEDRETIYSVMARAMATSLLWLIVIGTLGGLFIARRVLQRVDAMNASARTIMLGDLSGRLPVIGSNDELDRLALNLNQMIERIAGLMTGLRHVSDNIAHDLKTPLTRMRARAERTLADARNIDDHRAALEKVLEESDHLLRIFNALLMIARAESGAARAEMQDFDVSRTVRDVAELYEPLAEDAGGAITVDVVDDLYIHGNRELIGQALANLVDNALKHGRSPLRLTGETQSQDAPADGAAVPQITITARRNADQIVLTVADRGAGISASDRERVFDRFVRLEQARSTPGSGLGLSLALAIARLHNGDIQIADNNPGVSISLLAPALDVKRLPASRNERSTPDLAPQN